MSEERRHSDRLLMNLPIQIKVDSGDVIDLELVDISPVGLCVRGDTLSIFKRQPGNANKEVEFEIRVNANLAWVEPQTDGTFAVGLTLSGVKTANAE